MVSEAGLNVSVDGPVARLTLARPDKHNAFDEPLITELSEALARVGDDDAIRVVVLAAQGESFCAGADLEWMRRAAAYDQARNLEDARALARLMHVLDTLPKPTIARVHGAAIGGGVGLVACCDIAVAGEAAVFALSEVRLGLIPSVISPYVVAAIGARASRRYFLTGERFAVAEAHRLGLVHHIAADDDLDQSVEDIVAAVLKGGPAAVAEAKDLVRRVAGGPMDAALIDDTAVRIARVRAGDEAREGIAAFLERRAPSWRDT